MSPENKPRLSEEEVFAIFDVISTKGDVQEASNAIHSKLHLPRRHRTTIAAAFNVGTQFFYKDIHGTNALTTEEAEEIATNAGYEVSRSRVIDLHRLYQLWVAKRVKKGNKDTISAVNPREFIALIKQWREQLQIFLPDQILRYEFSFGLEHELPRRFIESKKDIEIYSKARQHHIIGINTNPLPRQLLVEQEVVFELLKKSYPNDAIWEAQELVNQANENYIKAFAQLYIDVTSCFQGLLATDLKMEPHKDNSKASYNEELQKIQYSVSISDYQLAMINRLREENANWFMFLRLAELIIRCGLLTLAISELPPNKLWYDQVNKLESMRSMAIYMINMLPARFHSAEGTDFIGHMVSLIWEGVPRIKQNARDVLIKLESLQTAHDDLNDKLKALELRLSRITE